MIKRGTCGERLFYLLFLILVASFLFRIGIAEFLEGSELQYFVNFLIIGLSVLSIVFAVSLAFGTQIEIGEQNAVDNLNGFLERSFYLQFPVTVGLFLFHLLFEEFIGNNDMQDAVFISMYTLGLPAVVCAFVFFFRFKRIQDERGMKRARGKE